MKTIFRSDLMGQHILAIDQGTTSSRSIIFSPKGSIDAIAQQEFSQKYPKDGWVEHDPEEIWESVVSTLKEVFNKCSLTPSDIAAVGITNQRETTLVWNKNTGEPVYPAIVWQDRPSVRPLFLCHKSSLDIRQCRRCKTASRGRRAAVWNRRHVPYMALNGW
jgi:glycerol kinase